MKYLLRLTPAPGRRWTADQVEGMQWDTAFSGLFVMTEDDGDDGDVTALTIHGFTDLDRVKAAAERYGEKGGGAEVFEVRPVIADDTAEEAARIGGGTANVYLAELLAAALTRADAGQPLTALDRAAISEAEERIGERAPGGDDVGDYYGPQAAEDAKAAGYTVYQRDDADHAGRWAVKQPDGTTIEEHHETEADAWDCAGSFYRHYDED